MVKKGHNSVRRDKKRRRDDDDRDRNSSESYSDKEISKSKVDRRSEIDGKEKRRFLDRVRDLDNFSNNSKKRHWKPKGDEDRWRNSYALINNYANPNNGAKLVRSEGAYIPPFILARMMKKEVEDKSSVEYQRLTWDALKKSINGIVNKVNAANIKHIVTELFKENLIRGRGLFCRYCMKSQMACPAFTDVFSALVAVVNTKFPEVGELLLKRIVLQLKRSYKRNDKNQLLATTKFIAHLVNQQVAHEIIALELLTVLLENPTDDSVEVAVGFVTECGSFLQDISPQGLHGIFERFRGILHEGQIDKRVQYLIEGLYAIRKAQFQGHPAVRPELDLVDQEDQLTHDISLDDTIEEETTLDIFKPDPQFLDNEKKYEELVKNILGDDSVQDAASSDESSDNEEDEDSDEEEEEKMTINDETETNLVNLRRTIYLTIMSSVDFEEAGHKLLKIKLEPGQEMELCIMLLECCSQERTYLRFYGLLGQRFCMIHKIHQENFDKSFVQQYLMIHRLETNKLRNVAKFFAHLLATDALPWQALSYIRLTEDDTTSSSRIFIKILFQELSEHLGIRLLNERLSDPLMQTHFESIFPKDNPRNTRFSINFFTSIGLGGITENLREYLKNMPRLIMQQENVSDSDESGSSESESERMVSRKKRRRRD
ncbi:Pre-mrna-splicing factor cwc22-like protein [Thalictrum thalictroides]|uniref:Pre-mrna-splicing factor cwc22-like protein n=1 Tax=Thalictrum thalictroides TaxID=46969 RepID=A0A7J6V5Z0_THATH|nr:Pre-mrna-splicing factor cwc22-like protein [Thalictrum thalictroides]